MRVAQELGRRGFEVSFYSRAPAERHPLAPELPIRGFPDAGPISVARQISRALIAARPARVVVHYTPQMWGAWRFGSPALPWLVDRVRRAGIPVFLLGHELYFPLRPARPDLILASGLLRAQLAALLWRADRVMVTTETRQSSLQPYCRMFGLPAPGVVRVGANALPTAERARGSGARFGIFSSVGADKRFDVLLDAFAGIARERPDAELVLIGNLGPADSPWVRAVMEGVRRHPASSRIRITGALDLDAVAREIGALDVYLCTMDTGANTRSSTLPSALGSGLPVVAIAGRETDGALFRNRENILFADNLSGPAVASAALEILRDEALARRLSEGARRLYEQHLAWSKVADQLLEQIGAG